MTNQIRLKIVKKLSKSLNQFENYQAAETLSNSGVYAFWWTGSLALLKSLNRAVTFKGKAVSKADVKAGRNSPKEKHIIHKINWDWNLEKTPVCLYVGKSVNIMNRIKLHLEARQLSEHWYGADLEKYGTKEHEFLVKRTTACQLRAGIEHLYKSKKDKQGLSKRLENFAFSFTPVEDFKERFYLEDLAIGYYAPWFNLDCER